MCARRDPIPGIRPKGSMISDKGWGHSKLVFRYPNDQWNLEKWWCSDAEGNSASSW
jgi:hypothetical protein